MQAEAHQTFWHTNQRVEPQGWGKDQWRMLRSADGLHRLKLTQTVHG